MFKPKPCDQKKETLAREEGAVRMVEHVMTKKMTVEHKKRKKMLLSLLYWTIYKLHILQENFKH